LEEDIEPVEGKQRDRARTHDAILSAAKDVLAAEGFQGFGINSIARKARCDKQLIYRYFGGLEGLVEAIGGDLANWISDAATVPAVKPATYGLWVEMLLAGYMAALRENTLVQKISAWEIADNSPLVRQLSKARSMALGRWIAGQRGELAPPAGIDAAATNAILIAAAQHLILASSTLGGFSGLALATDADWERAETALATIIRKVYAQ
jgi:AcrR family transcriptional regulator